MRQNTKELILHSAIELFSLKGFNASTTAEIAQKAGVAEVTIFRHYKTKKDILMAVLEHFMDTLGQEIILNPLSSILEENRSKTPKEILKMIVKDRIGVFEKNSDIIWIIMTEMRYHPELQEKLTQYIGSNAINLLGRAFTDNSNNEMFRPYSIDTAVRALMGTVISIILHYKLFSGFLPVTKTMDESIDEAVEILLYGISNR